MFLTRVAHPWGAPKNEAVGDAFYLHSLCCKCDLRGSGIGTELLNAAKTHAKPLYLAVCDPSGNSTDPARAVLQRRAKQLQRFYRRNGFQPVVPQPGSDSVLMLYEP